MRGALLYSHHMKDILSEVECGVTGADKDLFWTFISVSEDAGREELATLLLALLFYCKSISLQDGIATYFCFFFVLDRRCVPVFVCQLWWVYVSFWSIWFDILTRVSRFRQNGLAQWHRLPSACWFRIFLCSMCEG